MTNADLRLQSYFVHILEACERILRYAGASDLSAFLRDDLMQDAIIRNLEVIGEASRKIMVQAPDFQTRYPALPLTAAYQMRNALAHGYFQIDLELVWKTVTADIPSLERAVRGIIAKRES